MGNHSYNIVCGRFPASSESEGLEPRRAIVFRRKVRIGAAQLAMAGLAIMSTPAAAQTTVQGHVHTQAGEPIADVYVFAGGGGPNSSGNTDGNGHFKIEAYQKVVFLRKEGFEPLTRTVTPNQSLDVTMQPAGEPSWKIPQCGRPADASLVLGHSPVTISGKSRDLVLGDLQFTIPGRSRVDHPLGTDTEVWHIYLSGRQHQLMILRGALRPKVPAEQIILNSKRMREQALQAGGIEMSGEDGKGRRWRMVSLAGTTISYVDMPRSAAALFDKIIASACWPPAGR